MNCSICLDDLENKLTTTTNCNHEFHIDCLNTWTRNHNSCPLCRAQLYNGREDFDSFMDELDIEDIEEQHRRRLVNENGNRVIKVSGYGRLQSQPPIGIGRTAYNWIRALRIQTEEEEFTNEVHNEIINIESSLVNDFPSLPIPRPTQLNGMSLFFSRSNVNHFPIFPHSGLFIEQIEYDPLPLNGIYTTNELVDDIRISIMRETRIPNRDTSGVSRNQERRLTRQRNQLRRNRR